MVEKFLTCDVCDRDYPALGIKEPTVPEGTCVCGDFHLICYYCIKLLGLPIAERCPASDEVRAAAVLMEDE